MKGKIRIASRESNLAMAQTEIFLRLLKEHFPESETEIVKVKTFGDKKQNLDLRTTSEIGYFTKEIDEALLSNKADLAIHSLKDVGLERPEGLTKCAILKREDSRDVLLIHPRVFDKIKNKEHLVFGSSSARREQLLKPFLEDLFFNYTNIKPKILVKAIRGNVETRVNKIFKKISDEFLFDIIPLAFAGLERLLVSGKAVGLKKNLSQLKKIIVPIDICPATPGQGAIYIEARNNFEHLEEIRKAINHPKTENEVETERSILKEQGGGCHQPFGAAHFSVNENFPITIVRGKNIAGKIVNKTDFQKPDKNILDGVLKNEIFFASKFHNEIFSKEITNETLPIFDKLEAIFVTKAELATDDILDKTRNKKIYVSGLKTWNKLLNKNIFPEGCADGFGFEFIANIFDKKLVGLGDKSKWLILTHEGAKNEWSEYQTFSPYRLKANLSEAIIAKAKKAKAFFWTSKMQYQILQNYISNDAINFCGYGKTYKFLLNQDLKNLYPFPNENEFRIFFEHQNDV